jgi:hypothetical protein
MARFGFKVGLCGCIGLIAGACLALGSITSCSSADDPEEPPARASRPSAGGGAPSYADLSEDIGRVLVVGNSDAVPLTERDYRGNGMPGASGSDYVTCRREPEGLGIAVEVEAGQAGAAIPAVSARIYLPSASAGEFDFGVPAKNDQHVRVRLGEGDAFTFYEYALGHDPSTQQSSTCHVGITQIDNHQITGVAVCRALVATFSSLDATGAGESAQGRGSAAASIAFSCPFRALSSSGTGGASAGGTGGTFSGGTATAGASSSAGSGGSSGSSAGSGTGGTSGAKHCAGAVTPCSLRSDALCENGLGCTLEEDCTGLSSSCYSQFSQYACISQEGCYWSSASSNCGGSAWSCSLFNGSASCVSQKGCSWTSECTGVASSCSGLTEFTCLSQPGCRWE